jgi:phosphatidylglycerophosphatase A
VNEPDTDGGPGPRDGHSATLLDRVLLLLATGFGLGYIPKAPGTFGSLLGIPLVWGIQRLSLPLAEPLAAGLLFLIGIPICSAGARLLGSKDPGAVVFDEIAAFPVVFLGVPLNLVTGAIGFVLFRLFDILKPWPARPLERLPAGLGIMADDFVAALYAAAALRLIDWCVPLR